jgi:CBS domain-containing protein
MSAASRSNAKASRHRGTTPLPGHATEPSGLPYNVLVADVMSRSPISIGKRASLYDALVVMRSNRVTGLPVVDSHGVLDGVISERDLARALGLPTSDPGAESLMDILVADPESQPDPTLRDLRGRLEGSQVQEAMSRPPLSIRGEAPLEFAMEVMSENGIHRLPVVENGRLTGIVTVHDLFRSFVRAPKP